MIGKDWRGFGNSIRHDVTYRMCIIYLKRHLKSLFASFCDRDVPNFMLDSSKRTALAYNMCDV